MTRAERMEIDLLLPTADRVQARRARLPVEAPLATGVLFGIDRWRGVAVGAVAAVAGADVGLATLAPTDEDGQGGPHLIGAWVDPAYRRQGVGAALLVALAQESARRYGQPPPAEAITPSGWRAVQAAARTVPIHAVDGSLPGVEL